MKRGLTFFLLDDLDYLQIVDDSKVYYDNGQAVVTNIVHDAIAYVLAKDTASTEMLVRKITGCCKLRTMSVRWNLRRSSSRGMKKERPISDFSAVGVLSRRTT